MPSSPTATRHPWAFLYVRGWRSEIGLAAALIVSLVIVDRLGVIGMVLVLGALYVATRQSRVSDQWRSGRAANHVALWIHMGCWHAGIVGTSGRVPRVVRQGRLPVGYRFLVELPAGIATDLVQSRLGPLAAALQAREVRVRVAPNNARYVELVVVTKAAFAGEHPSPLLEVAAFNLWESLPIGVGEDGLAVRIKLVEHNLLIGGEPGSGKSVALSSIIAGAALDATVDLTLLDGKQVELAAWRHVANTFVGPDQDEALAVLDNLRAAMDETYQYLGETRRRKITPDGGGRLHVLVIDELAFYLRGGKKETRDRFAEALRDLVSRGRAAGIIVVAATQKPSHEVVPTWIRDLFSYRLAMRCTSPEASDTILGQGWAQRGFSASSIDPSFRGVGYLLAEGEVPTLFRGSNLDDDEIAELAERARLLRQVS